MTTVFIPGVILGTGRVREVTTECVRKVKAVSELRRRRLSGSADTRTEPMMRVSDTGHDGQA